jgi:hypothetical protein
VKTKERGKNPMNSERREQDPARKDKMDRQQPMPRQPEGQPMPRQPERDQPEHGQPRYPDQGQPAHRQPQPRQSEGREMQSRQAEPTEHRPGWPRERSDEKSIGRPVQLDDEPMEGFEEPDPAIKGEPQRERRSTR